MIIMKDIGVCLHNLGIFLGHGVFVTECTREEEFLSATLNYFVGFLNILDESLSYKAEKIFFHPMGVL